MNRYHGFTLIEVIVALAIVATALYAASGSVRAAVRGSGALEQTLLAHWAAANVANAIKLAPQDAEPAPQAIELYGAEFVVTSERRAGETSPVELTVRVATAAAPENVVYTLSTVLP